MSKVITLGEILMRLSPGNGLRFTQADSFDLYFGGGEYNVAVSLASFGIDTAFITRLPDNDLGKRALMDIRKHGVSDHHILLGGERLGLYFFEEGSGVRAGKVIYDRANSAMATLETGIIDWKKIFNGAAVFHWSGITPAISQKAADVCLEALKFAHQAGIIISCDLNYRTALWQYGKEPQAIMPDLLHYCTHILGDIDTALFMLGKTKTNPDYSNLKALNDQYQNLFTLCPHLKQMATTLRYSLHASHQQIGGIWCDQSNIYQSKIRDITPVVDRIGTGDAFMSGWLYGLLQESFDEQHTLDFAVAACCLKHTVKGDINLVSVSEIEELLNGNDSAKVKR